MSCISGLRCRIIVWIRGRFLSEARWSFKVAHYPGQAHEHLVSPYFHGKSLGRLHLGLELRHVFG